MDALMAVKRGDAGRRAAGAARSAGSRPAAGAGRRTGRGATMPARSDVAADNPVPDAAVLGHRVVKGIPLADYAAFLDERATFMGQWGLQAAPAAATGRPTRSWWRPRAGRGCGCGWSGCRPRACWRRPSSTATSRACSEGDDLVVLGRGRAAERDRFTFPRQRRDRRLCLADFFRPAGLRRDRRGRASSWSPIGQPDRRGHRRAVRQERLPRLPGAARPVGAARPRRWPSTGTRGSAPSSASAARTRPTWTDMLRASSYRGLPLLVRLPRLPGPGGPGQDRRAAASRSGSGSSCPRSSSCTRSSPPTRSSSTTPRPSTSASDVRCRQRGARGTGRGAVRHGRAARRHRAALVRGRDRGHGPARRRLWTPSDQEQLVGGVDGPHRRATCWARRRARHAAGRSRRGCSTA